jgi:hypothetical protein
MGVQKAFEAAVVLGVSQGQHLLLHQHSPPMKVCQTASSDLLQLMEFLKEYFQFPTLFHANSLPVLLLLATALLLHHPHLQSNHHHPPLLKPIHLPQ